MPSSRAPRPTLPGYHPYQVAHTKTESHILKQIRHPFLTRMHFAFQSEGKLYMVLNYLPVSHAGLEPRTISI